MLRLDLKMNLIELQQYTISEEKPEKHIAIILNINIMLIKKM